ncbi:MAG TPA: hypothetical protein VLV78_10015 [Thermoanaerobaculia bacterium]|nr:hypothetical protein [Thermoanaerobaculia bacterium]
MSVHSTGRFALLLLIMVPVMVFQCAKPQEVPQSPPPHRFPPPKKERYEPKVSVDVANPKDLKAVPRVAVVWDVQPEDVNAVPLKRSKTKKVTIEWTAKDPKFNLLVTFKPGCPIPQPACKGDQCTAEVPPNQTEDAPTFRCTYEMFSKDKSAKDEDADIIVTPCCW